MASISLIFLVASRCSFCRASICSSCSWHFSSYLTCSLTVSSSLDWSTSACFLYSSDVVSAFASLSLRSSSRATVSARTASSASTVAVLLAEPLALARGDSRLCPAAARAETGVPDRKERDLAWLCVLPPAAAADEVGVAERGVAREGVVDDDVRVEFGSRPVTGGFLAATVDMMWLCGCYLVDVVFRECLGWAEEKETNKGLEKHARYRK